MKNPSISEPRLDEHGGSGRSGTPHPALAFLTLALLCLAPAAQAQIDSREGIALHNEILELRQQMSQLQQLQSEASGGGGQSALPPPSPEGGAPVYSGASGDAVAQLVVRVGTVEEQMRTLEGRISEVENAERRDHDELSKQISDLSFKLGQGGGSTPGLVPTVPPPTGELPPSSGVSAGINLGTPASTLVPGAPAPLHRAPELALKQGNAALARRDYAAAEAAAREVLAMGHSPRSADATFLLARAQAGQHEYKDAAASFYGVYKVSPRGTRGAESLLGVANALIGLGDMVPACQALAKVSAEFPRPEGYVRAGVASARKRAGCH